MKREGIRDDGHLLGDAHLLLKGDLFLISRPQTPGDGRIL